MHNPNYLMARVLRARYVSDGDILNARLKKKSSYAWKSIFHGKELIVKGMRYIIELLVMESQCGQIHD